MRIGSRNVAIAAAALAMVAGGVAVGAAADGDAASPVTTQLTQDGATTPSDGTTTPSEGVDDRGGMERGDCPEGAGERDGSAPSEGADPADGGSSTAPEAAL